MNYVNTLSSPEIETLQQMYQNHPKRRPRMRAHSIVLSDRGWPLGMIAQIYEADIRSVTVWINRWEQLGIAGLYDQPRSGRSPILTDQEQTEVIDWIKQSPKDLKPVRARIEEKLQKQVSHKTIKRIAKKFRLVFKRMRKGPAKQPSDHQAKRATVMLERLSQKRQAGLIDVCYFDASGFSLESCVPYAWQPIGQTVEIPSTKSSRFSVLGILNPQDELFAYITDGRVDSATVIACLDDFSERLNKPTVVLLDRAPIHTSNAFVAAIRSWVTKGLIIKYLPSYSPQLNLIEIVWRFMKYQWLPVSAYECLQSLRTAVQEILIGYGNDYRINFSAA